MLLRQPWADALKKKKEFNQNKPSIARHCEFLPTQWQVSLNSLDLQRMEFHAVNIGWKNARSGMEEVKLGAPTQAPGGLGPAGFGVAKTVALHKGSGIDMGVALR